MGCCANFPLLNLLGGHQLVRSYGFQVYISMIHDLYIALCAHHLKSNHLLSSYIGSLSPPTTSAPLPSGIHYTIVCVTSHYGYKQYTYMSWSLNKGQSKVNKGSTLSNIILNWYFHKMMKTMSLILKSSYFKLAYHSNKKVEIESPDC